MTRPRLAHRYVGRHRNAGHGYPLHLRLRRQAAFYVSHVWGWNRVGYWLDFDRNRYLEEYPPDEFWPNPADEFDPEGWRELDPYGTGGGTGGRVPPLVPGLAGCAWCSTSIAARHLRRPIPPPSRPVGAP